MHLWRLNLLKFLIRTIFCKEKRFWHQTIWSHLIPWKQCKMLQIQDWGLNQIWPLKEVEGNTIVCASLHSAFVLKIVATQKFKAHLLQWLQLHFSLFSYSRPCWMSWEENGNLMALWYTNYSSPTIISRAQRPFQHTLRYGPKGLFL